VRPVVRPEVHDEYWRFAAGRHEIFLKRARGDPDPWTEDPILRRFKFCNSFRAADRVSQYLIREVIYGPHGAGLNAEDVFLRIVLFRLFSKEATWSALEHASGGLRRRTLKVKRLGDLLEERRSQQPIYTAAFILASPSAYGHRAKHRNHLALVADMFRRGGLGARLGRARSLKEIFHALVEYPMIGPFLGYQIAIDLNYSEQLQFDEDDFTVPGPGAIRGLRKVFVDPGDQTPHDLILRMVHRQESEFARLGLDFPGLFGRRLHAVDCQGLFCEIDKYSREAYPELKSNRVRIKQEYRRTPGQLALFFPPKWGINNQLPGLCEGSAMACGQRQLDPAQLALLPVVPAPPKLPRRGRAARSLGEIDLAVG
jgi:hypothetical protein